MNRLLFFLACSISSSLLFAVTDDADRLRRAVAAVESRLVRIDTIGGLEKVDAEFANEGTVTGLLLDRDGYVLTGAFNFLHDPTSILLRFADGSKKVARRVATDRSRMLTLLKVEGLDPKLLSEDREIRNKDSVELGERCLVLGVALSQDEPNLALGIISGKNRIWGKAIQTDAAVGPNNYGGPLLDLDGRLIALAVPLSMTATELAAGAETYDAGVGMAVPLSDVVEFVLPRLKEGKDLEPGLVGFGFKENRTFIGEAVLDRVADESPAGKAGLQPGDRILSVDGKPIRSALELEMNLRPRYAGETIRLTFSRSGEERTVSITTVPLPKPE